MEIDTIDRVALKHKLDNQENFKLVFVLGDWAYQAKRIPGSLNLSNPAKTAELLHPSDEIVVYCSDETCVASIAAYKRLKDAGYEKVRRYSGGLIDWEEAGFPLEGDLVGVDG
jgi:rhodanese-related sulfurtransferase